MVAKTDDHAFGNEIAQTDDSVIVEATRTSALPKANRRSLGLLLGTQRGKLKATRTSALPKANRHSLGLLLGTRWVIGNW